MIFYIVIYYKYTKCLNQPSSFISKSRKKARKKMGKMQNTTSKNTTRCKTQTGT